MKSRWPHIPASVRWELTYMGGPQGLLASVEISLKAAINYFLNLFMAALYSMLHFIS